MAGTLLATAAQARKMLLCVAVTAVDKPRTNGQPGQGFEGNRLTGIPLFDALTPSDLSAVGKTKWVLKPRPSAKSYDGSDLQAAGCVAGNRGGGRVAKG